MTSPVTTWPTMKEYDHALLNRAKTVSDPVIQYGDLARDATGPRRLNGAGGKYVYVYEVSDWAVRCFTGNTAANIYERYQAINAQLNPYMSKFPFLVPHICVDQGIYINGRYWPFVKAPLIRNSLPLGEFLVMHTGMNNRAVIATLARQWRDMMQKLEDIQVAHGDLDVTNILICGTPPDVSLRLIDYDGMYVPALRGYQPADRGHEHFQPVQSSIRGFNPQMDNFSSLVIYLSLIALADDPSLWEECDANEADRLLLGLDDFKDLSNSGNFGRLLAKKHHPDLQNCLSELWYSTYASPPRMPRSLSQILGSRQQSRPASQQHVPQDIPLPLDLLQPAGTANSIPNQSYRPQDVPLPVGGSQSLGAAPSSSTQSQPSRTSQPQIPTKSSFPWGCLIVFLIIAGIIGFFIWNNYQAQQHHQSSPGGTLPVAPHIIVYTHHNLAAWEPGGIVFHQPFLVLHSS